MHDKKGMTPIEQIWWLVKSCKATCQDRTVSHSLYIMMDTFDEIEKIAHEEMMKEYSRRSMAELRRAGRAQRAKD